MNKLNFKEDLAKRKAKLEEEAEAERKRKEAEREYNRVNKIRNENGSIVGVGGRPPGAKSKTTLFKEAMRAGFEEVLEKEGKEVIIAVCQRAKGTVVKNEEGQIQYDDFGNKLYEGGSDAAAKMIMDRLVPVTDIGEQVNDKFNISINITGLKAEVKEPDIEGEFEEI